MGSKFVICISDAGNIREKSNPIAIGQKNIWSDLPKFLKDFPNNQTNKNKKAIIKNNGFNSSKSDAI